MPIITVQMFEGRTQDQKRRLVAGITDVVVKSLNVPAEEVRITLLEMSKQNYAVAGVMASDRK